MALVTPLVLVDKSAWERAAKAARDTGNVDLLDRHGEPCLCAVTRLEILYSARNAEDYQQQGALLSNYRDLRIDTAAMAAAESAQRELAARGQHRVSLPDLLIAACAQQHAAAILHVDRHYDILAPVFGIEAIRLEG